MPPSPIRYIEVGPALPEASVAAATAPGRGMAEIGSAIESTGQAGVEIGKKLREDRERGIRSAFMADAERQAAAQQEAVLGGQDHSTWKEDTQDFAAGLDERAAAQGLSREGKFLLDDQLAELKSRHAIGLETTVAMKEKAQGIGRVAHALQDSVATGNPVAVQRNLDELRPMLTEDENRRVAEETQRKLVEQNTRNFIQQSPNEALAQLADPKFREGQPPALLASYESMARQASQQLAYDTQQRFEADLAKGDLHGPEDIGRRYPQASPGSRAAMGRILEHVATAQERELIASPEYQAVATGQATEWIDGFHAEMEGHDERYIEIKDLAGKIRNPATRNRLLDRLESAKTGQTRVWKHRGDEYTERLRRDYEAEKFGPLAERKTVRALIDEGLLDDPAKLAQAGLSPQEAAAVTSAGKTEQQLREHGLTPPGVESLVQAGVPWQAADRLHAMKGRAAQAAVFKELFKPHRVTAELPAYEKEALMAIHQGDKTELRTPDEELISAARRSYGKVLEQWDNWYATHPQAGDKELEAKYWELRKSPGEQRLRSQIVEPPPPGPRVLSAGLPPNAIR